ncbi:hypothetical protein HOK021_38160 [Streptomyces hygroscopicus]|nr:hypothetical protein HOK021_38160 [Streptomyces hygroscopicus]
MDECRSAAQPTEAEVACTVEGLLGRAGGQSAGQEVVPVAVAAGQVEGEASGMQDAGDAQVAQGP